MKRLFIITYLFLCFLQISAQTETSRISVLIGEMISWDLVEKGHSTKNEYGNGLMGIGGTPNKFRLCYRVCDVLYGDCSSDTIEATYYYRVYSELPGFPQYKYAFIPVLRNSKDEYEIIQMEDARKTIDEQWVLVKPVLGLPDYFNKNKLKVELKEPDPKCEYGVNALEVLPALIERIEELNEHNHR
jgi:hypothetical protein